MKTKVYILLVVSASVLINALLLATYRFDPYFFYFRAWEFFEKTIYAGHSQSRTQFREYGDSARNYLIQRYHQENRVTTNKYGNRVGFFEDEQRANVLFVGDSQLWGSDSDDRDTLTWVLAEKTGKPVYNGARKFGLAMLTHPHLRFDAIVFTIAERSDMSRYCSEIPQIEKGFTHKEPESTFLLYRKLDESLGAELLDGLRSVAQGIRDIPAKGLSVPDAPDAFLIIRGYLQRILRLVYEIPDSLYAPSTRLTIATHVKTTSHIKTDLACAVELTELLRRQNMKSAFMYFPGVQTIYGTEVGYIPDPVTLSFIDTMTAELRQSNIRTVNTRTCLMDNNGVNVYQMHDTHVNGDGYKLLAECILRSDMADLFR
jgi:hypothetical protein